jgi:hypothetical protein
MAFCSEAVTAILLSLNSGHWKKKKKARARLTINAAIVVGRESGLLGGEFSWILNRSEYLLVGQVEVGQDGLRDEVVAPAPKNTPVTVARRESDAVGSSGDK